jgi:hypothetical protein
MRLHSKVSIFNVKTAKADRKLCKKNMSYFLCRVVLKKFLKESKARAIIQSQSSFLRTCTNGRGLPSLSQIEDCLVIKHLVSILLIVVKVN